MRTFPLLRRTALLASLALAGGGFAETLTVVSWGGSYEQASRKAILEPFSKDTGIEIRVEVYNGGLAQVRAQVETGKVYWDLIDLEMADAARGCDEGLLEYVDVGDLAPAPDGTPAAEDFFEGTVIECGAGLLFYSTIYAYNADSFPDDQPSTIDDFFDLDRFPGRRGMRRAPQVNLEFALLADGVPVEEVYDTLGTPAGISRAFRKLDTIKEDIVWWEAGAQPPQMLADREVVMSTAYNGRIFNAQVVEEQPFVVVWDGQMLDSSVLAIVADTPNLAAARKLVRDAIRGPGSRRSIYLLQPRPTFRHETHLHPPPHRRRHEAAHADQSPKHAPRPVQRLGMVERPRGRCERTLQRVAGALTARAGCGIIAAP